MIYKTWKSLTKEQKEEYIFNFGQPNEGHKYSFGFLDITSGFIKLFLAGLFFGIFIIVLFSSGLFTRELVMKLYGSLFALFDILYPLMIIMLVLAILERVIVFIRLIYFCKNLKHKTRR